MQFFCHHLGFAASLGYFLLSVAGVVVCFL